VSLDYLLPSSPSRPPPCGTLRRAHHHLVPGPGLASQPPLRPTGRGGGAEEPGYPWDEQPPQWTNRPARSNFGGDRNCARGAHQPSRAAPGVMDRRPGHEKRPLGALTQRMAGAYTRVFVRRRSLREHIVPIWSSLRELAALSEAHRAGLVQTRGWGNSLVRARAPPAPAGCNPPHIFTPPKLCGRSSRR
jgi:hypothetical protein